MYKIKGFSKRARSLPRRLLGQTLFCINSGKARKRQEKDEEKVIEETHSTSISKYSEPSQVCIHDPKIFEHILTHLDIPTLRELRLVNKAWNEEVCRFLRKTIVITMFIGAETDSRTKEFGKFLFQTKKSPNLLPFRFLRLNISDWEDETLDEILEDDRILPREVCVKQDTTSVGYEARLGKILMEKSSFIQKLGLNVALQSFPFDNIQLPSLHVLFMVDTNDPEKDSEFVINLIRVAPNLRVLWIFGKDPKFVCKVLENSPLENILELGDLCMQSVFSKSLNFDKFTHLRKLTAIEYPDQSQFKNVPLHLVKLFSKALEELQIFWDPSDSSPEKSFPFCPKLRSIFIRRWGGSISAFNEKDLPNLKQLVFFDEIILSDGDQISSPHFGVNYFVMESYRREPERLFPGEKVLRFLKHVAIQFPSLTTLELFWRIKYEYAQLIVRSFPKLEKLFFYAVQGYTEIIFTGIEEEDLQIFLIESVDLNRVDRMPCLIDLKHLKTLTLLEGYVQSATLTKFGILHGISKIPKLETLTIHYDSRRLESDVRKSLSKVKTLNILTSEQIWEYKIGRQQQRLCSFMKRNR